MTTTDLPNFFRTAHGPGWALVGDAGRHRDPFLAHGIADAFRDAELLAEAIDVGLSGLRPLDEALADYERHRNAGSHAELRAHHPPGQPASLPAHRDDRPVSPPIQGDPDSDLRFLGLLAGSVPVSDFFDFATEVSAALSRP